MTKKTGVQKSRETVPLRVVLEGEGVKREELVGGELDKKYMAKTELLGQMDSGRILQR